MTSRWTAANSNALAYLHHEETCTSTDIPWNALVMPWKLPVTGMISRMSRPSEAGSD